MRESVSKYLIINSSCRNRGFFFQDPEALNRIKDLCHAPPYDADANHMNSGSASDLVSMGSFKKEKPNFTKDYKRLGFQNEVNPALDFAETPPGILALDCM